MEITRTVESVRRFTVSEAAARFDVHPQRLYRAIRSGALKAERWGQWQWVILEEDLLRWLSPNAKNS